MNLLKKLLIPTLLFIIVILAIILAMLLKPNMANVHFIMPDSEISVPVKSGQTVEFPNPKEYSGYIFLGWEDENGNPADSTFIAEHDCFIKANYGMAFDESAHNTFLNSDNGFFRPKDPITRSETVYMICNLLNSDLKGTESFIDIDNDDPIYNASSLLKSIGVLDGTYLHPDDYLTSHDFRLILSHFYPADRLSDIPDSEDMFLREQAAASLCNLLERYGDSACSFDKVGSLSDVAETDPYYWYIAESCIPHQCEGRGHNEVWTSSIPAICTENGFYFVGHTLHYIDNTGISVIDTSVGNIQFDRNGCWTSGNSELDSIVNNLLKELVDPPNQTRLEMLRILYNHVRDNYDYCYGNDYLPGQTGWANEEALKMIDRGIGNCYRFAGLFTVLARSIGYDAEECCGVMDKDINLHSWVEINIDGTQYIFDPQYEARFPLGIEEYDRFMKTGDYLIRYNAMREYRDRY